MSTEQDVKVTIDLSPKDRFARQKLIRWWDQQKLQKSKVLVVGAGALGNEIVKNLALVGVGNITIVDMDQIEYANLSRCVFFRGEDEGKYKSQVLAEQAMKLNPDISATFHTCMVQELGDAFLNSFDLVVAGLDNREARVWLGSACRRIGKVWIDGAIEGLMGKVQTFVPNGPCYACTMSEKDWELVAKRLSCKLLGEDEMLAGHTPTNATTSSVIAGVQCQEAIKYLVEEKSLYALENKVWRMMGDQMATFTSVVDEDEYCPFHFDQNVCNSEIQLPKTLRELWALAQVGRDSDIQFFDDFIEVVGCTSCNTEAKIGFKDLMKKQGKCQGCLQELTVNLHSRIGFDDEVSSLELMKDFWPLAAYVELKSEKSSIRISVARGE